MLFQITHRAVAAARYVVAAVLLFAVGLNFVNVVARYFFLKPIIWADEVMQYSMIWAVLIGMALVTWQGTHLKMEIVYELSPRWLRRIISALINLVTAGVSVFVIYQALQMMEALRRNNQHSVVARIPLEYIYLAIPVGFALTLLVLAVRLWDILHGGEGRRLEGMQQPGAATD